jgi:glycoside/pentoside/hexuronide:cation symporter, GPH family
MQDSLPAQPAEQKLNFLTKLSFGIGDFGTAISANVLIWFQLSFLTNVAQISPGIASTIRMWASIWDAINDPVVGMVSDRTRTRWGRRYPWMFLGALPLGIFFFLSWVVPRFSDNPAAQQSGLFWFYLAISVLFNTGYTAVNLPYTALTPELTQDYNERTSLNQYRFFFSLGGAILSLFIALFIFSTVKDPAQQYLLIAAICTFFCVVAPYLCILGTRRRFALIHRHDSLQDAASTQPLSYGQQIKIAFTNRPFLLVVGIYLFSWLAVQNTASIVPYYVADWMKLPAADAPKVALAVQGTALLMLPVWNAVCQRVGKKITYFMGTGIWILAGVGLFFVQPGQLSTMYTLAILVGFGVSTAYLIPWSMLPDVIELDELQTGQRREGVFYGFITFLQKIGLAIGQLITGYTLEWSGFVAGAEKQKPAVLDAVRFLIGPLPAIALVFGLLLAALYPITKEVHAEILLKLQEKKRQQL